MPTLLVTKPEAESQLDLYNLDIELTRESIWNTKVFKLHHQHRVTLATRIYIHQWAESLQAVLQAMKAMETGVGKLLGLSAEMTTQVRSAWLPLSEPGKNTLYQLPLESGQVFGAQAQEALNDCLLLSETRAKHMMQQIALRHLSEAVHNSHRVEFQRPQQWVVNKHGWFVTINLKDACFHVPIAVKHRHFSSSTWTRQVRLNPSGMASQNLKVATVFLQYRSLCVLDNWLLCG